MFGNIFDQSVPGQFYHVNLDGGRTVLAEPSDRFTRAVFYYWLMHIEADEVSLEVIPDGATDLVVSPMIPNFSAVYPPTIKKFNIPLKGPTYYAGISFEPESALQYFGTDIESLSRLESGQATTDALKIETLVATIQGVTDIAHVKDIFDQDLTQRHFEIPNRLGQSAYHCFVNELDARGIHAVTQGLGISQRQFRRTIHDISGLSPKQVQRIVRLQQLLHELFSSGSLAGNDGFYDDAHRIKELRELVGLTYGELRKMAEIYNKQSQ